MSTAEAIRHLHIHRNSRVCGLDETPPPTPGDFGLNVRVCVKVSGDDAATMPEGWEPGVYWSSRAYEDTLRILRELGAARILA
jgi:hypothetical protein